jgi:hypothetical protein
MSTSPTAASSLSLSSLLVTPTIILQRGDNDKKLQWGGQKCKDMGGQPVHELQEALVKVGAASGKPDGDFGKKTQEAVKRFQWYLLRMIYRLRVTGGADPVHGTVEPYNPPIGVKIDGFVREPTLAALIEWRDGGFETTSPLVAYGVNKLSNIELSPTFTVLDYPSPGTDEMLVHQDLAAWVEALNGKAKDKKVKLRVNQAFRVQGLPVSGAVVPPASSSQHLIGHALDVNIVDGNTVNTSAMFIASTATQAAKDLVKAAKDLGLRWGGDFTPIDPPHFDKRVMHTSDNYLNSFYFAQRSYNRQHAVRKA